MFTPRLAASLALGALLAAAPSAATAQAVAGDDLPKRAVSVMVGGFGSDINESATFGMAAARADFRLSRFILAEAGVSYARGEVEVADYSTPTAPTFSMESTSLGTATVGIQAELPLRYVRPYVGVASGLYLRLDPEGGHRFLSTTSEFPAGVRIPLTRSLGARGEVRLRYDEQQGNGQELGAEATFGFSWRF